MKQFPAKNQTRLSSAPCTQRSRFPLSVFHHRNLLSLSLLFLRPGSRTCKQTASLFCVPGLSRLYFQEAPTANNRQDTREPGEQKNEH